MSDHGDCMGARGIWGKGVMYEESAGIPMLLAGPDVAAGRVVQTPVSLIDLFPTILQSVGVATPGEIGALPGRSLFDIAAEADDDARTVFSEYHGAAATSGAFMLRDGRYKYIHYVGYAPELYDLERDPEELANLAPEAEFRDVLAQYEQRLREIVDPEAVNARALADQAAMVESYGGVEKMLAIGVIDNTPVPGATPSGRP